MNPSACVEHRTIGRWGGDYSVLSRGRVPTVHFLVGHDDNQWVQFLPTNRTAAHAAGANEWSVGIEFSGQNGEPLTPWQLRAGGEIHRWLVHTVGIRQSFLEHEKGKVSHYEGFLNHSNVATNYAVRTDHVTANEWRLMVAGAPIEEDDLPYTPDQLKMIFVAGLKLALDDPEIQNKLVLFAAAGDNAANEDE